MVCASRRVCTNSSLRNTARCCDKLDCPMPSSSTISPTENSPNVSWQRMSKRLSLANALSSFEASAACCCMASMAVLSSDENVIVESDTKLAPFCHKHPKVLVDAFIASANINYLRQYFRQKLINIKIYALRCAHPPKKTQWVE